MINQLIADYENTLCTEEMNLVVGFYNTVGDFDAAMVLCEKLSAEGYGKSLIRFRFDVSFTRNGAQRFATIGTSVVMVATICTSVVFCTT